MNFLRGIIDAVPSVFNISAVPKIIKEERDEANDIEFYFNLSQSFNNVAPTFNDKNDYGQIKFKTTTINSGNLTFITGGQDKKNKTYLLWDCWLGSTNDKETNRSLNVSKSLYELIVKNATNREGFCSEDEINEISTELFAAGATREEVDSILFQCQMGKSNDHYFLPFYYNWSKIKQNGYEFYRELSRFTGAFLNNDPIIHDKIRAQIMVRMNKLVCKHCLSEKTIGHFC